MNKAELVSKMAEKSELTKKEAEAALNAFMKSVEEALVAGDKVQLVGFVHSKLEKELLDKEEILETLKKL